VVQNCNDSGPGSLRDAYHDAPQQALVDLGALACSTITLSGALDSGNGTRVVTAAVAIALAPSALATKQENAHQCMAKPRRAARDDLVATRSATVLVRA
jgi:hypothetical protein